MPRIADIAHLLEAIAPPALDDDYDNSGLLVGEPSTEVTGVLVSLDVTEVVAEAVSKVQPDCPHHPIVFRPMKRLTGKNLVERTRWRPGRYPRASSTPTSTTWRTASTR